MRALRPGQDHVRQARRNDGGRWQTHLDPLGSHKLHTGAPIRSAAPISPEQRSATHWKRMQQHAHLARFRGRAAIPLTLLAQRAGATTAHAGCIHHA